MTTKLYIDTNFCNYFRFYAWHDEIIENSLILTSYYRSSVTSDSSKRIIAVLYLLSFNEAREMRVANLYCELT